MNLILISFLSLFSSVLFAQTSYFAPTKILNKKGYQLGLTGDYFNTSTRKDVDGEEVEFEDGESFSRYQGEFGGFYGLTENLQIGGGVRYRQNNSVVLDTVTEEKSPEDSSGVESTFFNLMYAFKPVGKFQYTLEGTFRFRPFTNEETEGANEANLVLGDDGNEYSGGLGLTYSSSSNNFLTGRVGYRSPGIDLSSEIYWQAEAAMAWRYIALVAGVNGVSSLKNSPFEEIPEERPDFNTGSTALYNSINREFVAPYVGLNLAIGPKWRVELRSSQVVSGKSTDLGTEFSASLITRVEEKKTQGIDRKFKDYDFEASINKVSPKKGYVVIDKGVSEDVQKGMKIDFYEFDYVGGNILIASGVVIQSKADTAIIKITQIYNSKKELKEGIIARGSFK